MTTNNESPKKKGRGGQKVTPADHTSSDGSTPTPQGDLVPLLRTAKRLKRSLTPVAPSPAFRAGLESELLQVARRLARYQCGVPTVILEEEESHRPAWLGLGLLLALCGLLATFLLLSRRNRPGKPPRRKERQA